MMPAAKSFGQPAGRSFLSLDSLARAGGLPDRAVADVPRSVGSRSARAPV